MEMKIGIPNPNPTELLSKSATNIQQVPWTKLAFNNSMKIYSNKNVLYAIGV